MVRFHVLAEKAGLRPWQMEARLDNYAIGIVDGAVSLRELASRTILRHICDSPEDGR
jgi:hypothetical protein